MLRRLLRGAAAGAAGVTATNLLTYADMTVRGRPASSAPEEAVEQLAGRAGVTIPGDTQARGNRVTGLGALAGIGVGVGIGGLYGLLAPAAVRRHPAPAGVLLGAAAMAAADVGLVRLGLTDPRKWSPADWASDVVPHAGYGLLTAWALRPRP